MYIKTLETFQINCWVPRTKNAVSVKLILLKACVIFEVPDEILRFIKGRWLFVQPMA